MSGLREHLHQGVQMKGGGTMAAEFARELGERSGQTRSEVDAVFAVVVVVVQNEAED